MEHDTLNKKISIPDLPRNPHVWGTPDADMLYNDHLVDPLKSDSLREEWLRDETDSNPMISTERDIRESQYDSELGGVAFKSAHREDSLMDDEAEVSDSDEEKDDEEDE
jgi:hypothetical protein